MSERSYEKIEKADLLRLQKIAEEDRRDFFERHPEYGELKGSVFAVALCQGSALHYLDGKNGIKDLDVWTFYNDRLLKPFYAQRMKKADFGDPKFGKTADKPHFIGRRVDLMGRSIKAQDYSDPVLVLRNYLRGGKEGTSPHFLAQKAVILIEPLPLLGTVVWPE